MTMQRRTHMLFGALVADAAALGVHWIYDQDRLSEIAGRQNGRTAFTPLDAANYAGVPSYFAHAARTDGALSQYGECLWLAIQVMNDHGGTFDVAAYQTAFAAHFGPGGTYRGYIDRPTRGALANIAEEKEVSGIDDDQLPAIARLPAILAAQSNDDQAAMHVTNVNEVATQYSDAFKGVLSRVLSGDAVDAALQSAADNAHSDIAAVLQDALATTETSTPAYGHKTNIACHLPMAGPLMFHTLKHATSYADAIERNNRAGGDSAGRAILLGAIMGAAHGVGGDTGVPIGWALKLQNADAIWPACETLATDR